MKKKRYAIAFALVVFFLLINLFNFDTATFLKTGKVQNSKVYAYTATSGLKSIKIETVSTKSSSGYKSGSFKSTSPSSGYKSGSFKSTTPNSGKSYSSGGFFGGSSSSKSYTPSPGRSYSGFGGFSFHPTGLWNILSAYVFLKSFGKVIIIIVVILFILSIFKRRRY